MFFATIAAFSLCFIYHGGHVQNNIDVKKAAFRWGEEILCYENAMFVRSFNCVSL